MSIRAIAFVIIVAASPCHGIQIRIEDPGDMSVGAVYADGADGSSKANPFGEAQVTVGGMYLHSLTALDNSLRFAQMTQVLDFQFAPAPGGIYANSYYNVYFHLDEPARYRVSGLMTWNETAGDAIYQTTAFFKPGGDSDPNFFYEGELTKGKGGAHPIDGLVQSDFGGVNGSIAGLIQPGFYQIQFRTEFREESGSPFRASGNALYSFTLEAVPDSPNAAALLVLAGAAVVPFARNYRRRH